MLDPKKYDFSAFDEAPVKTQEPIKKAAAENKYDFSAFDEDVKKKESTSLESDITPSESLDGASISAESETQFQNWWNTNPDVVAWRNEFKKEYGEEPQQDGDYNYRGAFKAGITPTPNNEDGGRRHWGSIGINGEDLKSDFHSTRWKSEYMKATGINPDEKGIDFNAAQKEVPSLEKYNPNKSFDLSYQAPTGKVPDFMGLFNKKEQINKAGGDGVSMKKYDNIMGAASQAEYPTDFIFKAQSINERLENIPKYFPQYTEQAKVLKEQIDNATPATIGDIEQAVQNIEINAGQDNKIGTPAIGGIQIATNPMSDAYYRDVVNKPNNAATKKLIADTKNTISAAATADDGTMSKISSGTAAGLGSYVDGYLNFMNEIRGNQAIQDIQKKMEDGNKESFTSEERVLLKALSDNISAHQSLDGKIPGWYKVGEAIGQSLPFMAEFVATAPVGGGVAKSIMGLAKVGTGKAAKMGITAAAKMAQAGIQTWAMPSLYQKTAIDVSKGENFGSALLYNYWDTYAQTVSERIFMANPAATKTVGLTDRILARMGTTMTTEKGTLGVVKSMLEESAGEKIGEIITAPKDYKSFGEFWKGFADVEQNKIMLGSVGIMTGVMGSPIIAGNAISSVANKISIGRYGRALPSDLRADIDEILKNETLSVKEQQDMIGNVISERIGNQTLDSDPTKTTYNAMMYVQAKVKGTASESVEQAKKNEEEGAKVQAETIKKTSETRDSEKEKIKNDKKKALSEEGLTPEQKQKINEKFDKELADVDINRIKAIDESLESAQERLKLPTSPDVLLSDDAEMTLNKIVKGEPVTNEFVKSASKELYDNYKLFEKMKLSDLRKFSIKQIEAAQEEIGKQISDLENYALKQKTEGEFIDGIEYFENISETSTETIPETKTEVAGNKLITETEIEIGEQNGELSPEIAEESLPVQVDLPSVETVKKPVKTAPVSVKSKSSIEEKEAKKQAKIKELDDSLAQSMADLMDIVGGKSNLTGEQRANLAPTIKNIAMALSTKLGIKGQELIDAVKKYFKDNNVAIPEDLVDEVLVISEAAKSQEGKPKKKKTEVELPEPEEGENLRQQGVKIIESAKLPDDIRAQFAREGIGYTPRGKKVTIPEATEIAKTMMKLPGGVNALKAVILDTKNDIKGDVRVALAAAFTAQSLRASANALTPEDRKKFRDDATEVLRFTMERSTATAQELQSYAMISEMIGFEPELIEDTYRGEIKKRNKDFVEKEKKNIITSQQIISEYLNSDEFKKKYNVRQPKKEGITPTERKERGIAKIAQAADMIADIFKTRLSFDGEIKKGDDVFKAITLLADGLLDVGVSSTADLIAKIKVNLRKYITSSQVDSIAKDILKETDAANRLIVRKKTVKLDIKDEKALVDKLYSKMTVANEAQLRRLIADNIELLEREGSISDDAFSELFAKAMGLDYVSQDIIEKLKESATIIHDIKNIEEAVDELFKRWIDLEENNASKVEIEAIKNEIKQKLKEHRASVFAAGLASQYISERFAKANTTAGLLATNIKGKLLTPASLLVNIVSNLTFMPIRVFTNSVAMSLDYAVSKFGGMKELAVDRVMNAIEKKRDEYEASTGKSRDDYVPSKLDTNFLRLAETLPDKKRTRISIGISKWYLKGFGRGASQGIKQMWTGQTPEDLSTRELKKALHPFEALYDGYQMLKGKERMDLVKFLNNSIEGLISFDAEIMFRLLNLGDKPFRLGSFMERLNEIANIEGLKGAAKDRFIEMPDEASILDARNSALSDIFAADNFITDWIKTNSKRSSTDSNNPIVKFLKGMGSIIVSSQIPYVKTPTNLLLLTIDYAMPVIPLGKAIVATYDGNRRLAVDNYAKYIVGSLVNGIVSTLFVSGALSFAAGGNEDDENADGSRVPSKVLAAEYRDKPPLYINIDLAQRLISNEMNGTNLSGKWEKGDEMRSYKRIGIISSIMMAHAETYRGMTIEEIRNTSIAQKTVLGIVPIIKSGLDQSFVKGLSVLVNAFTGSGLDMEKWIVGTSRALSATVIPNTARAYNFASDNYIRETKDRTIQGKWEKISNAVKADFKASYTTDSGLPIKITIWGEKVQRYEDGGSTLFQLFDISKTKVYRGDFGTKVFETYEELRDNFILPSVPSYKVTFRGKQITLDPETYEDFQIYVGTNLKAKVEATLNSEEWKEKTVEQKAKWLDSKFNGESSIRSKIIDRYLFANRDKLNELWIKQELSKPKK